MPNYNLTILINNRVDEKGRTGLVDDVKKNFGNLIKEDLWGVRSLAYEIKHMDKAFFAHFEFEAEPKSIITLDKNIRLNEDIIRYLLVKSKKAKRVKASKVMKEPEEPKGPEAAAKETVEATAEVKEEPKVKRVVKIRAKKKE